MNREGETTRPIAGKMNARVTRHKRPGSGPGGAPYAVRQLSSRPSGGSPTARRAAAPGGPGDRPHPVPAVSARYRPPRGSGRQPRTSSADAGKVTGTGAERRALSGSAPPASTVLRIPLRGTRLRRAVDPGASASPAGLTARARPKARPERRTANLRSMHIKHHLTLN